MAVTVEHLYSPKGEVEGYLFPGEGKLVLDARLQGYLSAGEGLVAHLTEAAEKDTLVTWYAHYRVFSAVLLRLTANPSQVTFTDQGGQQWTKDQLALLESRRNHYAGLLPPWMLPTPIVEVVEPTAPTPSGLPATIAVATKAVW